MIPFNELAPGAIDRECTYFTAGHCENGDDCPFKHKGREKEQEKKALAMEQKKKADSVPIEDSKGLSKKKSNIVLTFAEMQEETPADIFAEV